MYDIDMAYEDKFEQDYEPDQGFAEYPDDRRDDDGGDDGDDDGEPKGSHDMSDDAEALASAGHGTDEDYGSYGDCNEEF